MTQSNDHESDPFPESKFTYCHVVRRVQGAKKTCTDSERTWSVDEDVCAAREKSGRIKISLDGCFAFVEAFPAGQLGTTKGEVLGNSTANSQLSRHWLVRDIQLALYAHLGTTNALGSSL